MNEDPLQNGSERSNRDPTGKFVKGNQAGKHRNRKHSVHVQRLRGAMLAAMTEEAILGIMAQLEAMAEGGNIQAIKEYLDRAVGKPVPLDVIQRIEAIEEMLEIEGPIVPGE